MSECVKLYYWEMYKDFLEYEQGTQNLGDYLSKVVASNMVPHNKNVKRNTITTLYGIGSILGFRCQNAVVWGSGLLKPNDDYLLRLRWSSLDIRAVRGPKTREVLLKLGKKCPEIYGDPAVLMPLFFCPDTTLKKAYVASIVFNARCHDYSIPCNRTDLCILDIATTDYEYFITQIIKSKRIISSSLHGIILAETYGVPAVLLQKENQSIFKYEDWYYSTGRSNIVIAHSIDEALRLTPMPLPDLSIIKKQLLESFPYDLWK